MYAGCWFSLLSTTISTVTTGEDGGFFVIGCQETKSLVWQPGCILKPRSCLSLLIT